MGVTDDGREAVFAAQKTILNRLHRRKPGEIPNIDGELLRAARVSCLAAPECRDGRMACCRTCARVPQA